MDIQTFDALTRRATKGADRRALLGPLTGAVAAAILGPLDARADKGGKKGNDKDKKRDEKKCAELAEQCGIQAIDFCNAYR